MNTNPTSQTFAVRMMPIAQLVPAPYNPRRPLKPTDKAYCKLEASLREFGLVEPLVWNEQTGHVVGGHLRLTILQSMGVLEVPVSVVNLSETREKALNIVLNNQEAQGRFDNTRLAELLVELAPLPEQQLTGFDADMVRNLKLQPLDPVPSPAPPQCLVTVVLEMPPGVYEQIEPRLDELVREFDLVSHVQRT